MASRMVLDATWFAVHLDRRFPATLADYEHRLSVRATICDTVLAAGGAQ
jgi:hypothetical protein